MWNVTICLLQISCWICSEKIMKIGQHLPKLCLRLEWHGFFDSHCIMTHLSFPKVSCYGPASPQPSVLLSHFNWSKCTTLISMQWHHRSVMQSLCISQATSFDTSRNITTTEITFRWMMARIRWPNSKGKSGNRYGSKNNWSRVAYKLTRYYISSK